MEKNKSWREDWRGFSVVMGGVFVLFGVIMLSVPKLAEE
jgi:hypothetical protein